MMHNNREYENYLSLALEHIFFILTLKYWSIWCYRNAQRKKVLCEDFPKRRAKNLSSFPLLQPRSAHPTVTTETYWGWTRPITNSQHNAEQELKLSCFHSLGSVLFRLTPSTGYGRGGDQTCLLKGPPFYILQMLKARNDESMQKGHCVNFLY